MANLLTNVCNDVENDPRLLPVIEENLENQTATKCNETRLDMRSAGFRERGQQVLFDKYQKHKKFKIISL